MNSRLSPHAARLWGRGVGARYPVYCAWCLKGGVRLIIGWAIVSGSHGICAACTAKARQEIRA